MSSTALTGWLASQDASQHLTTILCTIASAGEELAEIIRNAPIAGNVGATAAQNVQGEVQKALDVISNDLLLDRLAAIPSIAAMVSEEMEAPVLNAETGQYIVCFDPLDGSSNTDCNGPVGTIFSVLGRTATGAVTEAEICRGARVQVAAGYIIYGPATQLVITTGTNVALFALAQGAGFQLQIDGVRVPTGTREFAINAAHRESWDERTRRYVDACQLGSKGPFAASYTMRWMGAMVADVHRILLKGGLFAYPALVTADGVKPKLRFLYEINPIAMILECAGGHCYSGDTPSQQYVPHTIHDRVPVVLGAPDEVARYQGE